VSYADIDDDEDYESDEGGEQEDDDAFSSPGDERDIKPKAPPRAKNAKVPVAAATPALMSRAKNEQQRIDGAQAADAVPRCAALAMGTHADGEREPLVGARI